MEAEAVVSSHEALVKVWVFVLVQALVYLILAQSSAVFSRTKSLEAARRPARSVSVRRMFAALSDMPAGGEPSPVAGRRSPVAVVDGRKKD